MPDKRFANKRSPIQRERDELTIAELSLKGWTQRAIADHLELDPSLINKTLKKIKEQWAKEKLESADVAMKRELKKLDLLEVENWRAWERSQGDRTLTLSERLATGMDKEGNAIGRLKTATKTEQAIGESAFLVELRRIIETRCKILGLNAPVELRVQEVAEAMVSDQLNLVFEAFSANPNISQEMLSEFLNTIAEVKGQAAVASEN